MKKHGKRFYLWYFLKSLFVRKEKRLLALGLHEDPSELMSRYLDTQLGLITLTPLVSEILLEGDRINLQKIKYIKKKLVKLSKGEIIKITNENIVHLATDFRKCFKDIDVALVYALKSDEYLKAAYLKRASFVSVTKFDPVNYNYWEALLPRTILLISDHVEIIKERVKKEHPNSSFIYLNPRKLKEDYYYNNYFELLDALKVEILKYEFDLLLIFDDLLGLPIVNFSLSLNKSGIFLGPMGYHLFSLATSNADLSALSKAGVDIHKFEIIKIHPTLDNENK